MLCVNHAYQEYVGIKPQWLKRMNFSLAGQELEVGNHQTQPRADQNE